MPLIKNRTNADTCFDASTTSIATTPVAACVVASSSGFVQRVMACVAGTTTGTIAVAVSINNGSDITGGGLTIAAGSNSRAGSVMEFAGVGSASGVYVTEGDSIVFTPSGGTGATIQGGFSLVIRAQN